MNRSLQIVLYLVVMAVYSAVIGLLIMEAAKCLTGSTAAADHFGEAAALFTFLVAAGFALVAGIAQRKP